MKKETVLSHTSELDTPVLSWLSSAERSLTALSAHFLSKIIILHKLSKKKEKHQINAAYMDVSFKLNSLQNFKSYLKC